jgi:HlyD family secretion protein
MQYLRYAGAGALTVAVLLGGCGKGQQQNGPPALDVEVAQAQRGTIATYLNLDGQVAPLQDSTIAFLQSGPITAVYVNQGDRVRKGELLAKIDDSTLRAQLAQAEAQVSQNAATAQSSTLNVPITQANVTQAVTSAKAALENAKLNYDQDTTLYKQGYVAETQMVQAKAAYVAAQTAYQQALANQGNTGVQSSQAQAAREATRAAQASANTLRTQIGQTALYAPFDGVVTARLLDPGGMANPGTPALRVSQVDTVWVNVNVPDQDLQYVRPGTPVSFTTGQNAGRTYRANITTVNAIPTQGTLSYQARIRMPNPDASLRGGMLVSVTIQRERHNNVIVVPRQSVAQTDQGANVFIVAPGNKAQEVPVQVGIQTDTLSEVRSPRITAGTQVITTRPDALQDGSVVAIAGGRHGQ